jgi:KTSC domain
VLSNSLKSNIQRISVSSSDLRSVGYDSSSEILEIEFHSGGIYQYQKVPISTYNSLMKEFSHGQFYHAYIKGVFLCKRIK